ncbi:hypothetical protein CFT12S02847_03280 [Campylobacter fetus subsp. testudinum]|uniref:Cj0814 family flagellar-dependent secreted protein n=1 Tax=Campylobacter fetus TaxID=196 RepID=UPI000818890B|nr:hypothetical protein [Campylobacter fetus]OCR96448.1 hypothetical protein CFT12S02847_03280 [Campylobacter fetus subsp. testudinum]
MELSSIGSNDQYASIFSDKKTKNASKASSANIQSTTNLAKASNINSSFVGSDIKFELASQPSQLQTNINSIKYGSSYGYSVDESGYMGADFNKAAGLPEDFKIHKSTLEEIEKKGSIKHHTNYGYLESDEAVLNYNAFSNIDMADTIKQYYNVFDQINSRVFDDSKQIYSSSDLDKLPKGYSSSGVDYGKMEPPSNAALAGLQDRSNEKVTHIFDTGEQYEQAKQISEDLSMLDIFFPTKKLDFSVSSMNNKTGEEATWTFNPDMSMYQSNEGYTKEAVFMSFLKSFDNMGQSLVLHGGDTKLTDEAAANMAESVYLTINNPERNKNFSLDKTLVENISNLQNTITSRVNSNIYKPLLESFFFQQQTGMKVTTAAEYEEFQAALQKAKDGGWELSDKQLDSYANDLFNRLNKLLSSTKIQ